MIAAQKEHVRTILVSLAILVLSGFMFLSNLDRNYLWQDEAQTALISRSILANGIPCVHDGRNSFSQELGAEGSSGGVYKWHPWLPFYVHAAFFQLFGQSDFVARLPDALFGMGTVLFCFWIMRLRGKGMRAAVLAAGVLILMVSFLLLSRQCRYYSMAAFFSMGSVWAYFQCVQSKRHSEYILAMWIILLFHIQMIYGIIFFTTVVSYSAVKQRKILKRLLGPLAGIMCCVIPWIVYTSDIPFQTLYGQSLVDLQPSIKRLAEFSYQFVTDVFPWHVAAFLFFMILWQRKKIKRIWSDVDPLTGFLVFYLVLTLVILSLTAPAPFFRYLAPLLPVAALLIAEIVELGYQANPLFGLVGTFIFLVNQPLPDYSYELTHKFTGPMEGIVGYLRDNAQSTDTVAITFGDMPLKWYTQLRVLGGLTGENLEGAHHARWVILRKHINCEKDLFVSNYLRAQIPWQQYRKIVLDAPDTLFENREDPQNHLYRTALNEERVVLYERFQ